MFKFILRFGFCLLAYYAATLTAFFKTAFFPSYAHFLAEISSAILTFLGQKTIASGATISGPEFGVTIARGCDGLEPIVIFMAGMVALRTPFRAKAAGIIFGSLLLWSMNLIRIASLYLIGLYSPGAFQIMHADVWQAGFILLAVVCWGMWMPRPRPLSPSSTHVPG